MDDQIIENYKLLRRVFLFCTMSSEGVEHIANCATTVRQNQNDKILTNECQNSLFIVKKGTVKISNKNGNSIRTIYKKDYFNERVVF